MRSKLNSKGLTLVEIIITLAILGIVITPLMSMFLTSQKINRESELKYDAIQLAQKYMEEIKSVNYMNLSSGGDYTAKGSGEYFREIPDDGGYQIEIELKDGGIEQPDITPIDIPDFDEGNIINVESDTTINVSKNDEAFRINIKESGFSIYVNNNSYSKPTLYVYKKDAGYSYEVKGKATIKGVKEGMAVPDNMFFYINIHVYYDERLIETVNGSKVFNSIITD